MKRILFALLLLTLPLRAAVSLNKEIPHRVVLLTVPKSGSHMIIKLFHLLDGREHTDLHYWQHPQRWYFSPTWDWSKEQFAEFIEGIFQENTLPWGHMNASSFVLDYVEDHPDVKVVVMIRDLRDVVVSFAHFFGWLIDGEYKRKTSLNERIMWILTSGFGSQDGSVADLVLEAGAVLDWVGMENALFIRFEDLVGPKGGGALEAQRSSIERLSSHLGLDLTAEERSFLTTSLFGKYDRKSLDEKLTWTFRKGQIGGWKEAFTEEHKRVFKERFGDLLIALGYEEDSSW